MGQHTDTHLQEVDDCRIEGSDVATCGVIVLLLDIKLAKVRWCVVLERRECDEKKEDLLVTLGQNASK